MAPISHYQQASHLWRFILLYRQLSGEQLSFMALKRDPARLRQQLIEARRLGHRELNLLIAELTELLDPTPNRAAPALSEPVRAQLIALPPRHAAAWHSTYRRLLEANLDKAYLTLSQRQMLDAFVQRIGLAREQVLQVEQEVRATLECPPIDWHLELMSNLPPSGLLSSLMLERLRQTYVQPERLSPDEFDALVKQHQAPSLLQLQKAAWLLHPRSLLAALVLLLSLVYGWLSWSMPTANPELHASFRPAASLQPELRIAGSNTLGAHLLRELARGYLSARYQQNARYAPATRTNETWVYSSNGKNYLQIEAHGSSTGFVALAEGRADIAASSRPIKPAEAERLRTLDDQRSPVREQVIALDGVALIVHPSNPLHQLDKTQIRALFSGELTNWSALGVLAGKIRLYARDDQSGTFETFKHLVLGERSLAASARRFEANDSLTQAVMQDPQAIGFVAASAVGQAKVLAVSDGAMAYYPSRFTLASEDYPLARRLYLYTASQPVPAVQALLDWINSEAGQQRVAEAGFIDLSPRLQSVQIDPDAPAAYRKLVHQAERLSMTFRFQPGTEQLDTRAEADLPRLVKWLERPELAGRQLLLLGFTDASGTDTANLQLSQARATKLAQALAAHGVQASQVAGFGSAVPLSRQQTPAAQNRNRRVELWLR